MTIRFTFPSGFLQFSRIIYIERLTFPAGSSGQCDIVTKSQKILKKCLNVVHTTDSYTNSSV